MSLVIYRRYFLFLYQKQRNNPSVPPGLTSVDGDEVHGTTMDQNSDSEPVSHTTVCRPTTMQNHRTTADKKRRPKGHDNGSWQSRNAALRAITMLIQTDHRVEHLFARLLHAVSRKKTSGTRKEVLRTIRKAILLAKCSLPLLFVVLMTKYCFNAFLKKPCSPD